MQLSFLAAYDASNTVAVRTIGVGDKVHNRRGQIGHVTLVDDNIDGPVYLVATSDGREVVWLDREILIHFARRSVAS